MTHQLYNQTHLTDQEAQALLSLSSNPDYHTLVQYLERKRESHLDKLTKASDDHELRRLQGRIQEIDEWLELPRRANAFLSQKA